MLIVMCVAIVIKDMALSSILVHIIDNKVFPKVDHSIAKLFQMSYIRVFIMCHNAIHNKKRNYQH